MLPRLGHQTYRIDVGNDANVADALCARLMVSMVAGVAPCNRTLAGQLGIFQHQQRQRPASAIVAGTKGGADEHPQV